MAGLLIAAVVVMAVSASRGGSGGGSKLEPAAVGTQTTTTDVPAAETFRAFATKNPFTPLASEASPQGTPTTTAPGGAASAGNSPPTTASASGEHIALLDVFSDSGQTVARVRVNDTIFEKLAAGQTFAGNLKVISLNQGSGCGSFLFSDDQFRLCKGQEVVK
jgi:hypothetical protein